jgi:Uma2 family endonuclease
MNNTKKPESKHRSAKNGRPDPTWTVARLSKYFGVAPERLILHPRPGMATEDDLLYVNERDRLCELVDGVLVEKAMAVRESLLAVILVHLFESYLKQHNLGFVLGPDGGLRLLSGLIRAPDVSFISWKRLPDGKVPEEPVPSLAPDLAVEIISKGNTRKEMDRKVKEYFAGGVKLVWLMHPKKRTVEVYTSVRDHHTVREPESLDGGDLLPGFSIDLAKFSPCRRPPTHADTDG